MRLPRILAACTCVLLVAGLLAPGWTSWANSTRPRIRTDVPDLMSVRILVSDPFDHENESVGYCFDTELSEQVETADFSLVGFNSAISISPSSVARSGIDAKCVEAKFSAGIDVYEYSLGAVLDEAVRNQKGFGNVVASAPLQGSTIANRHGGTTQPQVIKAEPNPEKKVIVYTFDESLDPTITRKDDPILGVVPNPLGLTTPAPDPAKFSFYDAEGAKFNGTEVVEIVRNTITISFSDTAPLAEAVSYSVGADAVADRQKLSRAGEKNPEGAIGEPTTDPELVSAKALAGAQINFSFDEAVQMGTAASNFVAHAKDGTSYAATRAVATDAQTVRASFPVGDFPNDIVYVVAKAGAVKSAGDSEGNIVGSAGVRQSAAAPGFTDGPDLELVVIDVENRTAEFHFDAPIKHSANAAGFRLVDSAGRPADAKEIVGWGERMALASFQGSEIEINDAIGGGIKEGTSSGSNVQDLQGNAAPAAALPDRERVVAVRSAGSGNPSRSPSPTASPSPTESATASGQQGASMTTTLASDTPKTRFMRPFTLMGTASSDGDCTAPYTIEISRRVHGRDSSRAMTSVTTDGSGAWSLRWRARKSASYVARPLDSSECTGVSSSPTDVLVSARVRVFRLSGVRRSCEAPQKIRGRVAPNHRSDRVVLQKKTRGWTTVDRDRLNRHSIFSLTLPSCRGRYRIVWPSQDERNLRGTTQFRLRG